MICLSWPPNRSRPGVLASRTLALVLAGCALSAGLSSCGADDERGGAAELVDGGATVVVANSPGTLSTNGPQRVMVALLGAAANQFLGGEDKPALIEFRAADGTTDEVPGQWLSSGVGLGLYVARYTFPADGVWEIRVKGNSDTPAPATVNVGRDSAVPEIGDPAPPSQTPTSDTTPDLTEISTDPEPDPRFYSLSVADAVNSGRPSVIVFATPAFCQTALCGPTLDIAKKVAATRPDVEFVHVEPYDLDQARAGELVPIDTMLDWNLATEPWVFVVDSNGKVAASFEGVIGQAELAAAIDAL